jgi:hypothetical protein
MTMTRKQRTQLNAFIQRKRRARCCSREDTSAYLEEYGPVGFHFTPKRHGLTTEQCKLATELLRRANHVRPIGGVSKQARFRMACRIAGIISAIKGGRWRNRAWGKRMISKKGGLTMAMHAPHILAQNRERIQARRHVLKAVKQQRQSPSQSYEDWQQALAAEAQQERQPRGVMAW